MGLSKFNISVLQPPNLENEGHNAKCTEMTQWANEFKYLFDIGPEQELNKQ